MLFAGPGALRNAVAAIRAGDGLVGVHRVAVNFNVRDTIGARSGQTAAYAHRRALLRIGAGAPVDGHLARHEGAVLLHATLAINHRLVARQRRDEGLFAVELHAHGTPVGVKSKSHCDGFDFQTAFGAEAAALGRIDEADFFLGHVQGFGDLVQGAKRRVVGDPDGQTAALFIPLGVGRVRLHGRVLDHRHEIFFFEDEVGFFKAFGDVAGAQLEVLGDVGVWPRDDEIDFAVFGEVFVDRDRARLTGLLRIGIDRQIFVFDFDQLDRGLRDVFVFRRDRGHRLADIAHFALGEKRLVFDRFAVGPGRVCSGDHRDDAGQLLGLLGVDLFYLGVAPWC